MLHKTRGIVLKTTNYSESSVVSQIYTEHFGLQSYLVNGARKPKAKIRSGFLQALHPLDMVVTFKDNNSLHRINEARQVPPLKSIPYDIVKSSLAIFLNEVLYKILREQSGDPFLFEYLYQAILWLDNSETNLANFHLVFLINLSRFLGFYPVEASKNYPYFNLESATFSNQLPEHPYVLQEPHTTLFRKLMATEFNSSEDIKMSTKDRQILLEKIIDYYRLHLTNFREIKSLYILEEIFH
ncbi:MULTISPECIES: DNA repair protein RecO [Sphingobacterium]|uniref:DNA repair protein RecO n=2 Tax=Sphingobacterium TaxID=28453 RepID=A0ABW5Z002_9SPHI|nr:MULTISPECIES: DNA repair protein RecO [Sphingobacterium]KKX49730.1 DNA repair protein [Sphingobacterium sp. IITKGP-BTPF85]MCS3556669.1 DNA repair protein RecO (recombination protein O) [Sphingobacterium sp. JUb21]MCW2261769.1 DNA repair protein RecO (recombination protein O) [Sphingobacterium kitahiroshimense]QQD15131.1 DNA repair protein RecO [Sphingobacterium sp. UDSM-2020]TCQ99491.1 DNA replication and repair protein RecO [Sphingobacterium sp. JUb20]